MLGNRSPHRNSSLEVQSEGLGFAPFQNAEAAALGRGHPFNHNKLVISGARGGPWFLRVLPVGSRGGRVERQEVLKKAERRALKMEAQTL